MKILLLASRIPFPLYNGEDLRVFHFAKHLSQNHDIHLLTYDSGLPPPSEITSYFSRIRVLNAPPINGSHQYLMSKLIHALSPEHMYFFDPEISVVLNNLLQQERFDLLWIPAWQMIPYARDIRKVPILLDVMDDGVLEVARDFCSLGSFKEAAFLLKKLFVTYLFERRYFRQVTLCCFCSERDAEVFRWVCPGARQAVIPNGVDSDYFQPLGLDEDFPSLVFEGNMSFSPSVDAVLTFCREILPLIWKEVPNAKLYIVGKDPVPEIRAFANDRIMVTGYVDDVRPYLDRASVFVCPMRKGAGIKNKVLQAWAMAKPVVATSIALGGLRAQNECNMMIADGPVDFAQQTIRLIRDPALRKQLGNKARETVLGHYSWEKQVLALEEALKISQLEARPIAANKRARLETDG